MKTKIVGRYRDKFHVTQQKETDKLFKVDPDYKQCYKGKTSPLLLPPIHVCDD